MKNLLISGESTKHFYPLSIENVEKHNNATKKYKFSPHLYTLNISGKIDLGN